MAQGRYGALLFHFLTVPCRPGVPFTLVSSNPPWSARTLVSSNPPPPFAPVSPGLSLCGSLSYSLPPFFSCSPLLFLSCCTSLFLSHCALPFLSLSLSSLSRPKRGFGLFGASLSPPGGRRGHTTLSQAIKLWSSALSMPGTPDVVLLDIAKAYPSTPHPLLRAAMQQVGVPDCYISMMRYAYQESRCYYWVDGEKHSYHQRRGVKEGCPLSPLLFCVVYEMFHGTLAAKFPSVHLYTYMDDVAFVSPDRSTTLAVLRRVTDFGNTLGFHVNKGKTKVYYWSATYKADELLWDGQVNTVRPPIVIYLGHIIAYPQWAHKARSDYLDLITSDVVQYAHIPMDGWERKQVVNSILMPRWLHWAVLIASDRWYKEIDDLCSVFVRQPKGMVPGRNTKQLSAPICC